MTRVRLFPYIEGGRVAKRLTDTNKWDKAAFMDLSPKMKLAWVYLCDKCDHAGVWDINLRLLEFHVGEKYTLAELQDGLGDRFQLASPSKAVLPDFVKFQYGELNPTNRVHVSVINRLQQISKNKPLASPLQRAKEKEKDKDSSFVSSSSLKEGEIPDEIKQEWEKTLDHYKRTINWMRDEVDVYRAFQLVNDWNRVKNALAGYRFEKKSKSYDPAQHVSLSRVQKKDSFLHLEAIGEPGLRGTLIDDDTIDWSEIKVV